MTNEHLWQGYMPVWPTNGPANVGGEFGTIPAYGIPFLNTLILLTSGLTVTMAHHALKSEKREQLVVVSMLLLLYAFRRPCIDARVH